MLFSGLQATSLAAATVSRTAQTFTTNTASISSVQKKFGTSSLLAEGGTNRFTINGLSDTTWTYECWARFGSLNPNQYNAAIFGSADSTPSQIPGGLTLYGNNIMTIENNAQSNMDFVLGVTLAVNTWHHIALTKNSNIFKLFINGTQRGGNKTFNGTIFPTGGRVQIGRNNLESDGWPSPSTSYIDEVRLSKIVRYTADFTPATAEFTNDADTIVLCHCEVTPLVDTII